MALGPGDEESFLWGLSSLNFESARDFQENTTSFNVRGVIWDIASVHENIPKKFNYGSSRLLEVRPLIVSRQYISSVLKYHVLTSEGIYTLAQNTPLEMFRRILSQFGSESKPLQQFCRVHGPLEILTMALTIICSEYKSDVSMRDNAIRIFFAYGGDPISVYRNPNDDPKAIRNELDYSPRNASIGDITNLRCKLLIENFG